MRALLVVALLATPAPALAYDERAVIDSMIVDTNRHIAEKKAARAAKAAERQAALTSLCDRLGGANIGDTADKLLRSCWGKPARVNVTTTASGSTEQWVYPGHGYFYLTNGIVTAAQTGR